MAWRAIVFCDDCGQSGHPDGYLPTLVDRWLRSNGWSRPVRGGVTRDRCPKCTEAQS